jgi:hypothetical protein
MPTDASSGFPERGDQESVDPVFGSTLVRLEGLSRIFVGRGSQASFPSLDSTHSIPVDTDLNTVYSSIELTSFAKRRVPGTCSDRACAPAI